MTNTFNKKVLHSFSLNTEIHASLTSRGEPDLDPHEIENPGAVDAHHESIEARNGPFHGDSLHEKSRSGSASE